MDSLEQAREALKLWREHGGSQHGPHVETLTMPLDNFAGFIAALYRPVEGVKGGALMERFFAMMNPPLTEGEKSVAALAFGFALAAPPVADGEPSAYRYRWASDEPWKLQFDKPTAPGVTADPLYLHVADSEALRERVATWWIGQREREPAKATRMLRVAEIWREQGLTVIEAHAPAEARLAQAEWGPAVTEDGQ